MNEEARVREPDTKAEQAETKAEHKPTVELKTYNAVLRSLVGKVVTMANPESLEDSPMGYQLKTGFYRAKVLSVRDDYISVAVELVRKSKGREPVKEPMRQFIPLDRIKRLSVGKSEIILHI